VEDFGAELLRLGGNANLVTNFGHTDLPQMGAVEIHEVGPGYVILCGGSE
jgi:hypothetical protein